MGRLLIVSNRLPVSVERDEDGLHFHSSTGGLATGLSSLRESSEGIVWIGWSGIASDTLSETEQEEVESRLSAEGYLPVPLSAEEVESYYEGFCNSTIWPLFSYFTQYPVYRRSLWESYVSVNERFCDVVLKVAREDDVIWVHDFQLMLLPELLREHMPDTAMGFFLHIPFPSFEVFRLLPWRRRILKGMLGADLVGFHTYHYAQHFLESVSQLLGYEHRLGQIISHERVVRVGAFPMGIDYERFSSAVNDPAVRREVRKVRRHVGDRKTILSLDRMDYTKGIPERLRAFDTFLEQNPEYREKVNLVLVAVPSRSGVQRYAQLRKEINELVGRINGKYGTMGWAPVWYISRMRPFHKLVALYATADVALITPLRDGMNLIAKEYVACKTDGRGVLILSEMAGAAEELADAIILNPNNEERMVEALKTALEMDEKEQEERMRAMQRRIEGYDVRRWANDFMDGLSRVKSIQREMHARELTRAVRDRLLHDYARAKRRLILLDYDGTLVPFEKRPERAKPDPELMYVLEALCTNPANEVVVVSGRSRDVLTEWLGDLNLSLVGEHGVWVRRKGADWEMVQVLSNDWKDEVRSVLQFYTDMTPGSFIEEKEFSLVWHYRNVDPTIAFIRGRELKEVLLSHTANLNIVVQEGSKVIEVKDVAINKGRTALQWLSRGEWDFILAVGDDRTDEDLFAALPEEAYSIRVGLGPSRARFSVLSHLDVRLLLKEMVHGE